MDDLQFDELLNAQLAKLRSNSSRAKPAKRMWREIEAIRDKKRLERELMEMDVCLELDDIEL